jgi:FAD/FMN-containing dehydrogenase
MPADAFTADAAPSAPGAIEPLVQRLIQLVGVEHVTTDPAARAAMSEDVFAKGGLAACVVAAGDTEETARVVAAATEAGRAIVPRGGGMSYTGGYLLKDAGAVVIDLRRMNRIVAVDPANMIVTVEAGATWTDLRAALKPHKLRTPFWGPLSGISSTIGGGLSQQNAFFGAGVWGPTSDSVATLEVVLADGSIVRTGSAGTEGGSGFFRHYGPDLAGLFLGDTGAMGIKTQATLRLIPEPTHEAWLSFAFPDLTATGEAMAAVARTGLACEVAGFDPNLAKVRMRRASLLSDAKTLAAVVTSQKSLLEGVKQGARMALAGRNFMDDAGFTLHLVTEGGSQGQVDAAAATLRARMRELGGREIENTIPKALRAAPFTPLNNVLGPDGERWAPIHGIVPLESGPACWAQIERLFDDHRAVLDAKGVTTGHLVTTIATNGFLIEPVFFWPGARFKLHETTVEASYLAKLPTHADDPETVALIDTLRAAILDVFQRHGAAHFQVGRTYRYAETRAPATLAMLRAIKAALDPKGLMNPGALGL